MRPFGVSIHAAAWVQASKGRTQGAAARKFGVSSRQVGYARSQTVFEQASTSTIPEKIAVARALLREGPDLPALRLARETDMTIGMARRVLRTIRFEELCLAYIDAAETGGAA